MKRVILTLAIVFAMANSTPAQIPAKALQHRTTLRAEVRRQWGLNMPYDAIPVAAGTIHQESAWNPRAASLYAQGLTQFTPDTWRWVTSLDPSIGQLGDVWSPNAAIRAMAYYHRWLWQRVPGSTDEDRWAGTLSSYNGGLGWYQRDKKLANTTTWFGGIELKNAGRAPAMFKENRTYVSNIWTRWRTMYAAF